MTANTTIRIFFAFLPLLRVLILPALLILMILGSR
jgi:hypothetical protein